MYLCLEHVTRNNNIAQSLMIFTVFIMSLDFFV